MLLVDVFIATSIVIIITRWIYTWRNPKCNGILPPGSMGWPLLGETLQFFTSSQNWGNIPFIKKRITRYGSVFRTSLVGLRVIVSTDMELNQMVFQKEGQLFEVWYPKSFKKVLGNQSLFTLSDSLHKYVRNMVLTILRPESLKKMLPGVETVATRNMEDWATQESVDLKYVVADMVFELMGKKLISYDPETSSENLRENFDAFVEGSLSFPLEIPGTAYYKCMQGRKKVMMVLKNILEARRVKPNEVKHDFFDYVLEELNQKDTILTEEIALDLMFLLLFASFETTSLAITAAMKFLSNNPRALKELTEEHVKILKKRENTRDGLTWEEYKSMTFTFQIINETLRLANVAPFIFRKAAKDIKFKGYTIPSGWVVMMVPSAVHVDPLNYNDPLSFNPWRWEAMDLRIASKTFMAFGGGQRLCVGADFAKLQMAVFLHYLVTKYQWKPVKGGDIVRCPGLVFPNGFHVQFFKKETQT